MFRIRQLTEDCFLVGFYNYINVWQTESTHKVLETAEERTRLLNGIEGHIDGDIDPRDPGEIIVYNILKRMADSLEILADYKTKQAEKPEK